MLTVRHLNWLQRGLAKGGAGHCSGSLVSTFAIGLEMSFSDQFPMALKGAQTSFQCFQ
jgi:hypothetical protein